MKDQNLWQYVNKAITESGWKKTIILGLLLAIIAFTLGYACTFFIVTHRDTAIESESITFEDSVVIEEEIKEYQIKLKDSNYHAVQVSSLKHTSDIDQALLVLKNEGIYAISLKGDTNYVMISALSIDKSIANEIKKYTIERHPSYQDAFIKTLNIIFKEYSIYADEKTYQTIQENYTKAMVQLSDSINRDILSNEINTGDINRVISHLEAVEIALSKSELNLNSEYSNLISNMIENLNNFLQRNATVGELNVYVMNELISQSSLD